MPGLTIQSLRLFSLPPPIWVREGHAEGGGKARARATGVLGASSSRGLLPPQEPLCAHVRAHAPMLVLGWWAVKGDSKQQRASPCGDSGVLDGQGKASPLLFTPRVPGGGELSNPGMVE